MSRWESVSSFLRVFLVFVVYSVAVQATAPLVSSLYWQAVLALGVTLLAVLALDAAPMVFRGRRPRFGEGSLVYASRGFLLLVGFIILAATLVDGLRGLVPLQEWGLATLAFLGAAIVVFGGVVAFYWRTERFDRESST